MFKIVKISESDLLTVNRSEPPRPDKEEVKHAEKAEAKPAEKAEAKPAEKAVPKIKLKKFTPNGYDYQEDKVFMDLEILIASYGEYVGDNFAKDAISMAKTDPEKTYSMILQSFVDMDHVGGFGGNLTDPEKLKAKMELGYKLQGAKSTYAECLNAIEAESIGNTGSIRFVDYETEQTRSYAKLITGLKKWDKKLKKLNTPAKPDEKEAPKTEEKEAPKTEEKEAPKPEKKEAPKAKGKSSLLLEAGIIEHLAKLANHLDSIDVLEEADFADKIIDKIARKTIEFDIDTGEVKRDGEWRNPTDGELADLFFGEDINDVGDLNPDSISYKKDEDGNDGVLELRDTDGDEIAEIIVDEPPENEISWHNLSREHVDSRPKNMTLPNGDSVTIEEIKLESNEMIKELVKLANHLDSKGFVKEADYLDGIILK
jgi:hypothetical protein